MITCSNCGAEQAPGNFCEKCGNALNKVEQDKTDQHVTTTTDGTTEAEATQQPNPAIEKVKKESGLYWNYSLDRLKNPSLALKDGEEAFMSSIITAVLLPLSIAIFFYAVVNNTFKTQLDFLGGGGLPFFPIASRLFILLFLMIFAGLIANVIMMKIAKNPITFKQLLVKYAGLQLPFTALFVVLALLGLVGILSINPNYLEEHMWMFVFLNVILIVIVVINPVLLTFHQLSQQKHKHTYYFSLLSLLFTLVMIYILGVIVGENFITFIEDALSYSRW